MVNEMCSLALMLRDRVVILFFTTKRHAMFKLSLAKLVSDQIDEQLIPSSRDGARESA